MRRGVLVAVGLACAVVLLVAAVTVLFVSRAAAPPPSTPTPDALPSAAERAGADAKPAPPASEPKKERVLQEDHGARRIGCDAACKLEVKCAFRTLAQCRAASCEPDRGYRKINRSDFCIAEAETCADMVLCTCDESCWRRGECAGDHGDDARCTAACRRIAEQRPIETYRENRCVLESPCSDLPACG
jgi:hypothetical protein